VGFELTRGLKNRRNKLMDYAREFYLLQAETVEIQTTDEDELVVFDRLSADRLRVTVFQVGPEGTGDEPFFERVFLREETREVRVLLRGGDDQARVQGLEDGKILITIVGGGGDDFLAVAEGLRGSRVRFFDDRGQNTFEPGPSTTIDESSYSDPHDWREDTHWAGTRDWGSRAVMLPHVLFEGDGGVLLAASLIRTGYGFRHYPHKDRSRVTLGFGTRTGRFHAQGEIEFPIYRQAVQGHLQALATGAYVHRYYGHGNETTSEDGLGSYEAFGREYRIGASAIFRISPRFTLEAEGLYSLNDPDGNEGTVLSQEAPYGFEPFNSVSLLGTLRWDGRDHEPWPTRGGTWELSGRLFPALGDVDSRFGKVSTVASVYLTAGSIPLRPTLALRAGGEKIWGDFPYHEAAVLGGSRNLRGFPEERFSGDASAFFDSELRLNAGTLPTLLPGSWGFMASTGTGRVWLDGEDSDRWHGIYGGGLWVSIIDAYTLTLSVSRSDEGTRFLYGGGGFHF
jgi:hypothetical protein